MSNDSRIELVQYLGIDGDLVEAIGWVKENERDELEIVNNVCHRGVGTKTVLGIARSLVKSRQELIMGCVIYERECANGCGRWFSTKRASQRYCSGWCRSAYNQRQYLRRKRGDVKVN